MGSSIRPTPTASSSSSSSSSSMRRLLLLTTLLASRPSSTTSFAPPASNVVGGRRGDTNRVVVEPRSSLSPHRDDRYRECATSMTTPSPRWRRPAPTTTAATTGRPFRSTVLFARPGPGRPRAGKDDDDDEDEEEDDDDDDDDDDSGYGEDAEEGEVESEEEEYDDEEGEVAGGVIALEAADEVPPVDADAVDVWASYDAKFEEPASSLLDYAPADPNYVPARDAILSQVEERLRLRELDAKLPGGGYTSTESVRRAMEYITDGMTDDERAELENDVDLMEAERILGMNDDALLTEEDLMDVLIEDDDGETIIDPRAIADAGTFDDDRGADAFPSSDVDEDGENLVYPTNGAFTERDLVELDDQIAAYRAARERLANQTYFGEEQVMAYMDVERDWPLLSNETQDEILDVIENSNTMACPEPEMWLMYDLKFNVTNLILASFRHNPEAPIIFTQWMPQLEVYERYADQRARNFAWTWDDVESADVSELERYYRGLGYDAVPTKAAAETGIITLDTTPMDDEEREMLALENWMDEVYNEESDNLLFDDENFEPRDNVYDPDFGESSSDKSSALEEKFMKEFEAFEREFSEEEQEWRDQFATVEKFEYRDDPEGQAAFRGHLVVACTPSDEDLKLSETIARRFKDEFGKAVVVETRVLGHARKEDNVFEVWLESYEIDLLHSKRQAFINSKLWTGPSEVDDEQLDYLVERVRYLISDDSRYSYRMSDYADIKA